MAASSSSAANGDYSFTGVLNSARELLIDLERYELPEDDEGGEPLVIEEVPRSPSVAAETPPPRGPDSQRANDHKELLLAQLDRLKQRCAATLAPALPAPGDAASCMCAAWSRSNGRARS